MRKNSVKNNRINGEVQRELSRIISREIKDPRISPMTSVVDVVVTPDLKFCKAYISVLGDQDDVDSTFAGLKSAMGYIRSEPVSYTPLTLPTNREVEMVWRSGQFRKI